LHRRIRSLGLLLLSVPLSGAVPTCPAGGPVGNVRLEVTRTDSTSPIPLARINQIEEGDRIRYAPVLRPNEKRRGKVTAVLVAAVPTPDQKHGFVILDPKDAEKAAEWKAPFRPSLIAFVYGPDGLSTRKLEGFLSKDDQVLAQLADYAEKTAQTEAVLQALSMYERTGASENLGAALQGFASRQGIDGKIDRTAPLDQQTLAVFRSLNPALSAYDPISPPGPQRISQTAGLATTVAGMFLGSTVGLAAGSASMALNLKSILLPNTEFRSAFAQPGATDGVGLCGRREPSASRSRLAWMWALRLPASGPPSLKVEEPRYLPAGLKSTVKTSVTEGDWKLAARARDWVLIGQDKQIRVPVTPLLQSRELELDLSKAEVPAGTYMLAAKWDWDDFRLDGDVVVQPLATFEKAELTPPSRNRLRQNSGKQVIQMEGDDFQFVRKVALVRRNDRYATPVDLPFSLPHGYRRGPQSTLEMQVDTTGLMPGEYLVQLFQKDGSPQTTTVQVLADPPQLEKLPIRINAGEESQPVVLHGKDLDRITKLEAEGIRFELAQAEPGARTRTGRVRLEAELKPGAAPELNMFVRDYGEPIRMRNALEIAAPRPRILDVRTAAASGLGVTTEPGELAAGYQTSALLRMEPPEAAPTVHLTCGTRTVSVSGASAQQGVRLQVVEPGSLFVSFDPGMWPGGCTVTAAVETPKAGRSDPREIGRVVRIPQIESFRLTDEGAGDGTYFGILTGRNLELIDRTGWDGANGQPVSGLPAPVAGDPDRQSLRVRMPWPSPIPHAPLYVWLRGESRGRQTTAKY
jgi:hypothetical protein